jgi:phage shock protein C
MTARRTKFYLNKQNAKISGICAGIADYTGFDLFLVRMSLVVLTFLTFPTMVFVYWLIAWMAPVKPLDLYDDKEEERFWQGVRQSPSRSARDVRSTFRDLDRRLAEVEIYYTSRNSRLADEIDSLR